MEQSHSQCESLMRQRDDAQRESERLRTSFRDVERTLGTRERAHRHRVKGLEEQVHTRHVVVKVYQKVKRVTLAEMIELVLGVVNVVLSWTVSLQVSTLKEQLQQEMKRRQPSLPSSLLSTGK